MREKRLLFLPSVLALVAGVVILAGCCGPRGIYPQPGFAGVPQAIHRSADYALPLSADARTELAQFMAAAGNQAVVESDPPRRGQLQQIEFTYGAILNRLQGQAPSAADLRQGTPFSSLFDTNYLPLVIHDARLGWDGSDFYDPGTDGIRALVKSSFVFAFYARRVVPATNSTSTVRPNAWALSGKLAMPEPPFNGLVVFSKNFAIPTITR